MIKVFDRNGAGGSVIVDALSLSGTYAPGERAFGMRMILGRNGRTGRDFTAVPTWYDYAPSAPRGPWLPDLADATDAASGSLMATGQVIWRDAKRGPGWSHKLGNLFDAAKLHAQMAETEARANPARGRKLWMLESVRVPRTHPDVVAHGKVGAAEVATRRRAFVLTPETQSRYKNYIVFRQFDPKHATREYRTLTRNGVQMVSAVVKATTANAPLKLIGTSVRAGTNRGKPVLAVYRGPGGIHAVAFVTKGQLPTLPDTATLASLAAKYGGTHKAGATLSGVRLVRVVPRVERASKPKSPRRNPRPAARRAAPARRTLAFWV